ncbi:MAG: peptide deformylase [Gammaproteobacteria bacterium]|nr:peptide deformylase [Gammaproteobacteria bacterium]MDH5692875.1 peptide deformylase [Gammaproteobacteria bacterium]
MAARSVIRMGHPVLATKAREVKEFDTPDLHELLADMFDTMAAYDGAGLAAPQIAVDLRIVVFEVSQNPRYPDAESVPRTVLINPVIKPLSDAKDLAWEGCLSVPGMRGAVPRHTHIRYTGFDEFGQAIDRMVQGFHARVVQHECDHLDGILYPQRIEDLSKFGFIEELEEAGLIPKVES